MKPAIPVPHAILHDPRTVPAALAAVIDEVKADVARRIGLVGEIQRRLEHDFAMQRLGMASNRVAIQSARDQFAVEKVNLEITQMTLAGLRVIEAARSALQDSEDAQHAAAAREKASAPAPVPCFDPRLGRLVTPASA